MSVFIPDIKAFVFHIILQTQAESQSVGLERRRSGGDKTQKREENLIVFLHAKPEDNKAIARSPRATTVTGCTLIRQDQ